MKRAAVFLAVAAIMAAPLSVLAAEPFSAALTPEAEVPPADCGDNACSGETTVTISDDESSIDYEVSYENMTGDVTGAHIHFGGPDVAGPVMIPFEHGPSPFSGTFNEADYEGGDGLPATWEEALDAIREGDTYVNVHTEENPGGEIRGQLEALPDTAIGDAAAAPSALSLASILFALFGAAVLTITLRRAWVRAKV